MKRLLLPLVMLVAIAVAVAAAWYLVDRAFPGRAGARGGGEVASETRPLPAFSQLVVDGLAEVTLVQGTAEAVTVEAPAKQLPKVRAEVRDGTLTLTNEDSRGWWSGLFGGGSRPVKFTVAFRKLDSVRAAGAVKLKAESIKADALAIAVSGAASLSIVELDAKDLTLAGSGAMKAEVAGRVRDQKVSISGAGDYRAANLVSETAQISVSGAGKAVVNAAKTLDVRISGAGSVDYLGSPEVHEEISGAGRVRRRESALGQSAFAETVAPVPTRPRRSISAQRPSGPTESSRA